MKLDCQFRGPFPPVQFRNHPASPSFSFPNFCPSLHCQSSPNTIANCFFGLFWLKYPLNNPKSRIPRHQFPTPIFPLFILAECTTKIKSQKCGVAVITTDIMAPAIMDPSASNPSMIILIIVVLIVGCLLLACMVGGLWLVYSRQKVQRPPSNVQYYPYYAPTGGRGYAAKDVEMSTEFR